MLTSHPRRTRCIMRVAAGPRTGFGHLMRARALARVLDMDVAISVRGGAAARDAARAVAPLACAEALSSADVLVVDDPSHIEGGRWVARARRAGLCTVSVHDDARVHDADLVVCPGLAQPTPVRFNRGLFGTRFYLLDPAIAQSVEVRTRISPVEPRVVVALGGGQHVRTLAPHVVDAIAAHVPAARIVVAAGFSTAARPPLRHAEWLDARGGLTAALRDADIAIVAGGVTLYEACALGVPSVGLAVVPTQRRAIRAFAARGALIDAGVGADAVNRAAAGVAALAFRRPLATRVSTRARQLVDGRGAQRVADAIDALVRARRAA